MSFIRYPVAIAPDGVVSVPDLDVSATGATCAASMDAAEVALAIRIKELVAAGEAIPSPSMMADVEERHPGLLLWLDHGRCQPLEARDRELSGPLRQASRTRSKTTCVIPPGGQDWNRRKSEGHKRRPQGPLGASCGHCPPQ